MPSPGILGKGVDREGPVRLPDPSINPISVADVGAVVPVKPTELFAPPPDMTATGRGATAEGIVRLPLPF